MYVKKKTKKPKKIFDVDKNLRVTHSHAYKIPKKKTKIYSINFEGRQKKFHSLKILFFFGIFLSIFLIYIHEKKTLHLLKKKKCLFN